VGVFINAGPVLWGLLILVVARAILNLVKPPYTSLCEIVHLVKHPTGGFE
jgi:hypothetical protein